MAGMEIEMPCSSMKVPVIIPNWNEGNWQDGCLRALESQDYRDFEILVVDDASKYASLNHLEESSTTCEVLRLTEHKGFAREVNAGIRLPRGICRAFEQ